MLNAIAAEIRNAENPAAMLEQIKSGSLEIMGIKIEETDVEVKRVENQVLQRLLSK